MSKPKRPQRATESEAESPVPAEVLDLPGPLAVPLTAQEKRAHLKRRDQLLKLHNTAARLSAQERSHAHSAICAREYQAELERLLELRSLKPRDRGGVLKPELERRIKLTAHNLADSLFEQGEIDAAYNVVATHDRKHPKLKHYISTQEAIDRPDDEHCDCPPESKCVERRIFVPARGRFVEILKCACGHRNATEQLPAEVAALRKAPAAFKGERVSDEHLIQHAMRQTSK